MKKRLISLVMAFVMIITLMPAEYGKVASAAETIIYVYEPSQEITNVRTRKNARQTFTVDADYNYSYCNGISYQWYSVDKNGKETELAGETADKLVRKITDFDISYKCKMKGIMKEGHADINQEREVTFRVTEIPGLIIKSVSNRSHTLEIGDSAELSVEAEVDSGYTLSYQWYELVAGDNGIVRKDITGVKGSRMTVKAQSNSDFGGLTDPETDESYRYGVVMTVKDKDGKEVNGYKNEYHFVLFRNMDVAEFDSNSRFITVRYGEDQDLYAKFLPYTDRRDNYKAENTWYKEIASVYMTYSLEYSEPGFVPPEHDKTWQERVNGSSEGYPYIMHYYKKADSKAVSKDTYTYTLSGDDFDGNYMCVANVYDKTDKNNSVLVYSHDFIYDVDFTSELTVHAKNNNVKAAVGGKAEFEVVAATYDTKKCPVTYKWERFNSDAAKWETIDKASGSKYQISKVTSADYGNYRVTVNSVKGSKKDKILENETVNFTLAEDVNVIIYTPEYAFYKASSGDTVSMTADAKFPENVKPVYVWYRSTSGYVSEYDYDYDGYWEILNKDTKEYMLKVSGEDDFRKYKCVMSYRSGNTLVQKSFIFDVEKYGFSVEVTAPQTQYKLPGGSAFYSVRAVGGDGTDEFSYEWYKKSGTRYNLVKGAASNTYSIDRLELGDFGYNNIYCVIKDDKNGTSRTVYFSTYREIDAYIDYGESGGTDTVETAVGKDVTLKPGIVNGGNYSFTFQWRWGGRTIHGAAKDSYTINSIGDNEFGYYYCDVYYDGAMVFTYNVRILRKTYNAPKVRIKGGTNSVETVVGKSVQFEAEAKSDNELELKYQWYFRSSYESSYQAVGGATSAVYKIDSVIYDNVGIYKCVVTDSNGMQAETVVELGLTTGMYVDYDVINHNGYTGYEAVIGGDVTLNVNAGIAEGYKLYYEWQRIDRDNSQFVRIPGKEENHLKISGVSKDDLGIYRCRVYDLNNKEQYVYFKVYLNTGLQVVPGSRHVLADAEGIAVMAVTANANPGETITYKWYREKYVSDDDWDEESTRAVTWQEIKGAESSYYSTGRVKKSDYGNYMCEVSTGGETCNFMFSIEPDYKITSNRSYVEQDGSLTFNASIGNPASDAEYTYEWYAQNPFTGELTKTGCKTPVFNCRAPRVNITADGYKQTEYACVIKDSNEKDDDGVSVTVSVRVLPLINYSLSRLPETNHPNNMSYDVQAYRIPGAKKLKIEFDANTELGNANLFIIDSEGFATRYWSANESAARFMGDSNEYNTIYVTGDSAIFLMNGNTTMDSYGYGVKRITGIGMPEEEKPGQQEKPAGNPETAAGSPQADAANGTGSEADNNSAPAKGTKTTVNKVVYKVTKSAGKNGAVEVVSVNSKKIKSVTIAKTVKINGYTFKVTSIAKDAFKGCSKLKTITVNSTTIKNAAKSSFAGVSRKAAVYVPQKQKKAYKALFKKGGFKGKIKVIKVKSKSKSKNSKKKK